MWFLGGKDTASQNVLLSLANWDHGESLEQLVRLGLGYLSLDRAAASLGAGEVLRLRLASALAAGRF